MSDLLKYTCSVRDVNFQYQEIHNKIFRLSLRTLIIEIFEDQSVSFKKHADRLKMLHEKLMDIQTGLNTLPRCELNIRRGEEIFLALSNYIIAISKSINYLQKICNDKNSVCSDNNLVNDKKIYDDAIQHHKKLGDKLNGLLLSF